MWKEEKYFIVSVIDNTFRGSNSAIFSFAAILMSTLTEKNWLV